MLEALGPKDCEFPAQANSRFARIADGASEPNSDRTDAVSASLTLDGDSAPLQLDCAAPKLVRMLGGSQ